MGHAVQRPDVALRGYVCGGRILRTCGRFGFA
jgi:hypothetical protein